MSCLIGTPLFMPDDNLFKFVAIDKTTFPKVGVMKMNHFKIGLKVEETIDDQGLPRLRELPQTEEEKLQAEHLFACLTFFNGNQ